MTTRDSDAIAIEKWGRSATDANFTAPEDLTTPFDQEDGWPVRYATAGGDNPEREVFNWWWRGVSALVNEVNTRGGILPWDDGISYVHPALVFGSDGEIYHTVRDNNNVDPTTDSTNADWQSLPSAMAAAIVTALNAEIGNDEWQSGGGEGTTDLSITRSSTGVTVRSSTGDNATIPRASTSEAGVMAAADKTQLDGTRVIRSGTSAPDDSVGADGDLYLQRS